MGFLSLIICLTCVVVDISVQAGFNPAEIIAKETDMLVGTTLELRCAIPENVDIQSDELLLYLCKDAVGIKMGIKGSRDFVYTSPNVTSQSSGTYSCIYTTTKPENNRVTGTGLNSVFIRIKEIIPAEIISNQTDVLAGATLELRCVIPPNMEMQSGGLLMHLCKDGVGIKMGIVTSSGGVDYTFPEVTSQDSGSYSCVYTTTKYKNNIVTGIDNSVFIRVKDFGSARIVVESTHVMEGESMDLKCAHVEVNEKQDAYKTWFVYLCKDGIGISKREIHSNEEKVFTLVRVRKEDSGHYSCVYSLNEHHHGKARSTNENSVIIYVEGQSWGHVIKLVYSVAFFLVGLAVVVEFFILQKKR